MYLEKTARENQKVLSKFSGFRTKSLLKVRHGCVNILYIVFEKIYYRIYWIDESPILQDKS